MVTVNLFVDGIRIPLTSPYMIEGIYPPAYQGFHQKIGMTGYHGYMPEKVSEIFYFTVNIPFDYIEVKYHTNEAGIKEEFQFTAVNIEFTRYAKGDFTTVEDGSYSHIYEWEIDAVYEMGGRKLTVGSGKLLEVITGLDNGMYLIESLENGRAAIIIESGRVVSFRLLP
jgi:hypothetical protein